MLPTIGIIYIVGKLLYWFTASMARPGGAPWLPFKVDGGSSRWTTRHTHSHRWSTHPTSQIPRDLRSSCTQFRGHRADCASVSSWGRRSRGSMEPHD
uniref:Putative secreted protein n=1 Tax=Ixodes ricinus TaxID=34613 RepID=A0A6B0UDK9_IXORI